MCELGLATEPGLSRRAFVSATGATVGGAVVALSLPVSAAASSIGGGLSTSGFWTISGTDQVGIGPISKITQISLYIDVSEFNELGPVTDTWTITLFGQTFSLFENTDKVEVVGGTLEISFLGFSTDLDIPELNEFVSGECKSIDELEISAVINAGGTEISVAVEMDDDGYDDYLSFVFAVCT